MLVAIDAIGIRGHGGAAVLCELLRWLPQYKPNWSWHVCLLARHLREFDDPSVPPSVTIEQFAQGDNAATRLLWVNRNFPRRASKMGANVVLSMANLGAVRPSVPQVVYCHQARAFFDEGNSGGPGDKARFRFMRYWIARGANSSAALIVQTESMRAGISRLFPNLRTKIHVIPSGFRTPSTSPIVRPEKLLLIESSGKPRLIYVSHPSEHKNHDALIRAMPRILKVFPSANLLLTVGKDRSRGSRYAQLIDKLENIIRSEGINDHILRLGVLTPDEVSYALSRSCLMVYPSLAESFGLPLVEAISAGCPIAASNLPYAHDVAGAAATYFEPRDPHSIATAIVSVLESPTRVEELKAAAAKRKQLFAYPKIAACVAAVLESAAEKHC